MFMNAATDTNIIFYLMIAVGVIGVLSKTVNHLTLSHLLKAAGNMSKSKQKLMHHVRTEYEHACMAQGSVRNALAFIRKYFYEYRGFLFCIHTWKQLEIQTIWFSGILAVLGAAGHYMAHGLCEGLFQYMAVGIAEMTLLFVVSQLTDESYQIKGIEIYMTDYLENVCAQRYKKTKQTEEKQIEIMKPKRAEAVHPIAQEKAEEEEDVFSARKEEAIRLILAEFLA